MFFARRLVQIDSYQLRLGRVWGYRSLDDLTVVRAASSVVLGEVVFFRPLPSVLRGSERSERNRNAGNGRVQVSNVGVRLKMGGVPFLSGTRSGYSFCSAVVCTDSKEGCDA